MEDLLEELLNVLALPSDPELVPEKESSLAQPLALGNGSATQKTQVNGFSISPQTALETAHKATEKMGQQTAPKPEDESSSSLNGVATSRGSSGLMKVAALSESAIAQLIETAQSLETAADASQEVAVESLLFDAGVAVPESLGHQAFSQKDERPHEVPLVIEQDAPQAAIESVDEAEEAAEAFETEAIEVEAEAAESNGTEIDEAVMSAFDIGDFEADAHAAQASSPVSEDAEATDDAASASGTHDFDPDDFELSLLDLNALDLDRETDAAAHPEANADERLETADISLDELVGASERNFVSRWFRRLVGAKPIDYEQAMAELPEPKLFESDYDPLEVKGNSQPSRESEYESEFYAEEAIDRSLESIAEPSVDAVTAEAEETAVNDSAALNGDLFGASDEDARSLDKLPDEPLDSVPTAAIFDPADFDLDVFEPDAPDEAAEDGSDEESLLEPLGEKAWLSEADNANESLHVAAAAGDLSGVWAALEANASVNALVVAGEGDVARTALSAAIESGQVPVVAMLLEMCADPNLADAANGAAVRYPLMVAVEVAEPMQAELLSLLLNRGAKVNQANAAGQTALMRAADSNHVEAMRRLIEANADLDAADLLGQTALLRAKGHGHEAAVALLQEAAMDRERAIAFLRAVTQGNLVEVEQWLAAGMSANTRVARMSALTQAAAKGEIAIAKLLIEAGAEVDYRFYETDPTPLFHAAYRGQLEMVSLLLEAGARSHPMPHYPIGALDYAEIGQQRADDATAFEPIVALLATLATRPD